MAPQLKLPAMLALPLVLLSGCALAPMTGHATTSAQLAELREPEGVCAYTGGQGAGKAKMCIVNGSPRAMYDQPEVPRMFVVLTCDSKHLAEVGSWQLKVWRAGQLVTTAQLKEDGVPSIDCMSMGYGVVRCLYTTAAGLTLDGPKWGKEKVDIELTYIHDVTKTHRATFQLGGAL